MANLLTGLRLLAVAPFAWLMTREDAAAAIAGALLIVLAIATDLADGPVARRAGRDSAWGRLFDHATDFLFVTGGLLGGALRGAFPLLLPVLIAVAFAQYVVDSYWLHRRRELRMSALGRWNGILYFVPLCIELGVKSGLADLLWLGFLAPTPLWIAWALVITTLLSIGDRLLAIRRPRRTAPGSPVAGR